MAGEFQAPPAGQDPEPTISQLGPYALLHQLGEGAMAVVFLAEDTMLKRQVAVKIISSKLVGNPTFLARFQREAQAAGKLNHPNIAGAYAVGEERGLHYYVMEYCEGETLDQRLKRAGRFDWYPAVQIARQVAEGLQYAHKLGFVHRDIKPANLMLARDAAVKILDFGLSKNMQQNSDAGFQTMGVVTIGTPHYISPEQARGEKEIDGRADIYSLGATLYHLLTGATLFKGETTAAIIIKHVIDPLPDPADQVPDLPGGLRRVLAKMMARKREDRYADCGQLIQDLDAVLICGDPVHTGTRAAAAPVLQARRPVGSTSRFGERAVPPPVRRRETPPPAGMDPRVKTAIAGAVAGVVLLTAIAVPLLFSGGGNERKPAPRTSQLKTEQTTPTLPGLTRPPMMRSPELPPPVPTRTESKVPSTAVATQGASRIDSRLASTEMPPRVVFPPPAVRETTATAKAVTPDIVKPRVSNPSATQVWESMDIGTTGAAGSTNIKDQGFTVKGAGKDIWDKEDSFHFVYMPVKGDVEIVAQVISIQNTDDWAKAGVMVRETLTGPSKHALMTLSAVSGAAFQHRLSTGDDSDNFTVREDARAPCWVRLVRTGDWLTGYESSDGTVWRHAKTVALPMSASAYIGLAVCSHAVGRTTAVEFRNVRITSLSGTSLPEGCETSDIGSVDLRGGAGFADGGYTVVGAGSDIWKSEDGFRFLSVRKSGDFDLRARIVGITQTDMWAKAGLMVRQSTEPGSVHATIVASASNGYLFEHRDRKNAITDGTGGGTPPFPSAWVRLTREGRTVRAYRASDGAGTQFVQIGAAVSLNVTDPVLVGLCVTSHNNEKLTLAEFRDVSGLLRSDSLAGARESVLPSPSGHPNQ